MVLTITPIDFHGDTVENRLGHGFINIWTRSLAPEDIDRLIEAHGTLPGDFMGSVFSMMTPMRTMLKYNFDLLEVVDDEQKFLNFLRMEKWIADRPHHPGEAAKQWLKDLYQDNKLVRNEFELSGRKVDLRNITCPVLNVFAKDDHIIPPATSQALAGQVGTERLHRAGAPGRACRRLRRRQVAEAARPRHRQVARGTSAAGTEQADSPMAHGSSKIVPVEDAVAIVRPGDTVATSGFVGVGTPDAVIAALEQRFLDDRRTPRDLTLVFAAAPGDGQDKGLNRLAREGLVRRRGRRSFRPRPEARPHGDGRHDRGLQPAARLHLAALPRDRRPQGGPALEGRAAEPSSIRARTAASSTSAPRRISSSS